MPDQITQELKAFGYELPEDLNRCISFHGHLCPGLLHGYVVARHAARTLGVDPSLDEEVVTICENSSCAVDAMQVLLGTTIGKGNLQFKNHGKMVFTIFSRDTERAIRYSRQGYYSYKGEHRDEFRKLEQLHNSGNITRGEKRRKKMLQALDLIGRPIEELFRVQEVDVPVPEFARIEHSVRCAQCGELTMESRMVTGDDGKRYCIPCAEEQGMVIGNLD